MDNNSKGNWIEKNALILFYKDFTEVQYVSHYLEYRI